MTLRTPPDLTPDTVPLPITLDPTPVGSEPWTVADPITVTTSMIGYGTFAISLVARDRIGLLAVLARHVLSVDPTLHIDGARAALIEDIAFVNLLVRPRTADLWKPSRHQSIVEGLSSLAETRVVGLQCLPDRTVKLTVRGPDRLELIRDLAGVLAEHRINVNRFESDPLADAADNSEDEVSRCRLTFRLTLPSDPEVDLKGLSNAISALDGRLRFSWD